MSTPNRRAPKGARLNEGDNEPRLGGVGERRGTVVGMSVPEPPEPTGIPEPTRPGNRPGIFIEPAAHKPTLPAAQQPSRPSKTRRTLGLVGQALVVCMAAVLGALGALTLDRKMPTSQPPSVTIVRQAFDIELDGKVGLVTAAAAETAPAVVAVQTGSFTSVSGGTITGSGSGVVLRVGEEPVVITNQHVVAFQSRVRVELPDGRRYLGEVIGTDPYTDLAVVRLPTDELIDLEVGSSDDMQVGDEVVAVGYPLGLTGGPTVTAGHLSAKNRQIEIDTGQRLEGLLQVDSAIAEGSSGGALANLEGKLVGITTAVGISGGAMSGLGFAVPVEVVERVAADLVEDGQAPRAMLGIEVVTAVDELGDGGVVLSGTLVEAVQPGSAAENAGIEPGDVLVAVDGMKVEAVEDLLAVMMRHSPGDEVEVTVQDGDETRTLIVVAGGG